MTNRTARLSKKSEERSKSTMNGGKAAPAPPGQPAISSKKKKLIIGGGAAALIILGLLVFWVFTSKEKPPQSPRQAAVPLLSPEFASDPVVKAAPGGYQAERSGLPLIQAIRLLPSHPTRLDTLKAEIVMEAPDPGRIAYRYVWKVNDQIVEAATGDALNLSAFKKWAFVCVTVTPHDGDKEGLPVQSPVVAIHSIPPSLELQAQRQRQKSGEAIELQLVSVHPDSNRCSFSLVAPVVPGMSIDSQTGRITWLVQPDQKGLIRFGAAVEDEDATKITKIFEITVD